jgi:hypothetical protein
VVIESGVTSAPWLNNQALATNGFLIMTLNYVLPQPVYQTTGANKRTSFFTTGKRTKKGTRIVEGIEREEVTVEVNKRNFKDVHEFFTSFVDFY